MNIIVQVQAGARQQAPANPRVLPRALRRQFVAVLDDSRRLAPEGWRPGDLAVELQGQLNSLMTAWRMGYGAPPTNVQH